MAFKIDDKGIKTDAIDSSKIVDGSVTSADIANGTIAPIDTTFVPAMTGQAGKIVTINEEENGFTYNLLPQQPTPSFLSLPDTPDLYMDQAGKAVIVNQAEDGLEFGTVAAGGTSTPGHNQYSYVAKAFGDHTDPLKYRIYDFSVVSTANDATTTAVYRNGIRKFITTDYTLSTWDNLGTNNIRVTMLEDVAELEEIVLEQGISVDGGTGGGGSSTFITLTDAPASYLLQANKVVSVKTDETGLEFVTVPDYEPANANIQSHISDVTSNPHSVTAAQTGAEPANANIQTHIGTTGNPHGLTKADLSLDNVPNVDCTNASNITSGTLSINQIPQAALERLVPVLDQAARFALTTNEVQLGDTVKQTSNGLMYYVKDTANLGNEAGYEPYTAGSASSVPWSGVSTPPTTLAGYGITDAASSTHNHTGTYEPASSAIQTHVGITSGNPHGTTAAQTGAIPASTVTTSGDIIVATGNGTVTRLAKGSDGQTLSMSSGNVAWATPAAGGSSTLLMVAGEDITAGKSLALNPRSGKVYVTENYLEKIDETPIVGSAVYGTTVAYAQAGEYYGLVAYTDANDSNKGAVFSVAGMNAAGTPTFSSKVNIDTTAANIINAAYMGNYKVAIFYFNSSNYPTMRIASAVNGTPTFNRTAGSQPISCPTYGGVMCAIAAGDNVNPTPSAIPKFLVAVKNDSASNRLDLFLVTVNSNDSVTWTALPATGITASNSLAVCYVGDDKAVVGYSDASDFNRPKLLVISGVSKGAAATIATPLGIGASGNCYLQSIVYTPPYDSIAITFKYSNSLPYTVYVNNINGLPYAQTNYNWSSTTCFNIRSKYIGEGRILNLYLDSTNTGSAQIMGGFAKAYRETSKRQIHTTGFYAAPDMHITAKGIICTAFAAGSGSDQLRVVRYQTTDPRYRFISTTSASSGQNVGVIYQGTVLSGMSGLTALSPHYTSYNGALTTSATGAYDPIMAPDSPRFMDQNELGFAISSSVLLVKN